MPAVPLGEADGEPLIKHGTYTEEVTRKLSAAAYVRDDWISVVRLWWHETRKRLKSAARRRLRWLLPLAEGKSNPEDDSEQRPPVVVLGEDYALWVRRRIKKARRPVPVYAFDQAPVIHACDRAIGHRRRRTALLLALVGIVAWQLTVGSLTIGWAALTVLGGSWAVSLADRYMAQKRVNSLLSGELPAYPERSQAHALPYLREQKRTGKRDRFVGAGLEAWQETVIGIDVEPAPESQDDDDEAGYAAFAPPGTPGIAEPSMHEVAKAVLDALQQHGRQSPLKKSLKHFTTADLQAHVAKRLDDPAPNHHRDHPQPRMHVEGIAGIHHKRWDGVDDETWQQLHALAVGNGSAKPAEEVARRYIWSRVTAWNGGLVAAVLVHFAYQGGFLRVTVRPHIMGPLNPAVAGIRAVVPTGWRWFGRAVLNAVGDIPAGLTRLVRRKARPCPELDSGTGPISLRETYSTRSIDDMHMRDDARYYVQMMQRRVFDSTEVFLRAHNVDIAAYRQQSTAIYNFGVMNGGTMSGPVQAAPFSETPSMS